MLFVPSAGGDPEAAAPFVVWFNFFAGFGYVAAAFGLALARRWSVAFALALAVATAAMFAAFGPYVAAVGSDQTRTVYALAFAHERVGRDHPGRGPAVAATAGGVSWKT